MEENQIDYADIKALGFKTSVESDSVYENTYGFPYKIISLKLRKNVIADWDQLTRQVVIQKCKDNGIILETYNVPSLENLRSLVAIFKK